MWKLLKINKTVLQFEKEEVTRNITATSEIGRRLIYLDRKAKCRDLESVRVNVNIIGSLLLMAWFVGSEKVLILTLTRVLISYVIILTNLSLHVWVFYLATSRNTLTSLPFKWNSFFLNSLSIVSQQSNACHYSLIQLTWKSFLQPLSSI